MKRLTMLGCTWLVLVLLAGCKQTDKPAGDPDEAIARATGAAAEATILAQATAGKAEVPAPPQGTPDLAPGATVTPTYPTDTLVLIFHPTDPHRMWLSFEKRVIPMTIDAQGTRPEQGKDIKADGQVMALAYPKDGQLWLGGQGVFRHSPDEGATWVDVKEFAGLDVVGITYDPNSPKDLFALIFGHGLLHSPDGGAKWDIVGKPSDNQQFGLWALSATPLRLATYDVVQRVMLVSDDRGAHWRALDGLGLDERPLQISLSPDGKSAYAATATGLYVTTDGGENWSQPGSPKPPQLYSVAMPPDEPATVIAVGSGANFYRSRDGGKTW